MEDRKLAMEWWETLTSIGKSILALTFYPGRFASDLTGREIEYMWKTTIK
jgi:hypothetical protein